ncbi:TPA: relaxase/mobilization nuclease domain-containing protein [Staphylococcus aureus]|uniref:relaxase/mobilization nuclease domain-containing protein n=1 Tax=Staphylococcus aureus TaxID=1280 RepID=UPI000CCFF07C|nr:relaxase/mobilization nuclease domain-containing protein [Staphylococcus aureus]HCU9055931.1 relaxase/mobilization nuclease domain-containing protein [Staphylococcus aureus]HCU9056072.1 relaxase/mobilization nuclease domain-containing protein [Staphylococcus aureus]HDA1759679.1 relaxase/mobilization nuclease domain-containing protein [Staphylococcus aureus]HDA1759800.1 relaxase/mobilization nuclease domain-containing protein [Staphylococcus aureus]HDD7554622.1 relaxase/mobilization nuclease
MATTKLGNTKSASRAINYAEKRAEEKSGLNCDIDYAKSSFKQTRALYGKENGVQAHTVIQSFKPGEVTPEQCNQLGLELAKKIAPNHQVAVYTHTDKDHVHNHIVINSIDLETGRKYQSNKQQRNFVKQANDDICREHGLSVPERDTAKLRYTQAEKSLIEKDQFSWKDDLREKIEHAKEHTSDFKSFSEQLEKSGIEFKVRGKNVSYKPENVNKWVRGKTLGQDYDKGALEYEFERREREEEQKSERDSVAEYTDQFEVDWGAVEHNAEQLRKARNRRIEKAKQAHHQVSNRDTRESELTRERTKGYHIEIDMGDEGFSR